MNANSKLCQPRVSLKSLWHYIKQKVIPSLRVISLIFRSAPQDFISRVRFITRQKMITVEEEEGAERERYFSVSALADNHLSSQICEPGFLRAPRTALCRKQMVPGMSSSRLLRSRERPERRVKEGRGARCLTDNFTLSACPCSSPPSCPIGLYNG